MIHKVGKLRGDKTLYPDGVNICLWHPMGDDEGTGLCWDFSGDDLDDLILLLLELREAEADVYEAS